jgi:hypothetical protein
MSDSFEIWEVDCSKTDSKYFLYDFLLVFWLGQ